MYRIDGPTWVRFVLAAGDGYWTGAGWSPERRAARLYADEATLADEYNRIVEAMAAGRPVREYEATVRVRVCGDGRFDRHHLLEYLNRASHLYLDPVPDAGPLAGATVLATIVLAGLREVCPGDGAG